MFNSILNHFRKTVKEDKSMKTYSSIIKSRLGIAIDILLILLGLFVYTHYIKPPQPPIINNYYAN